MQKDSAIWNINAHQRFALLATLAMSILVLLLHFPFDGYVTEYSYTSPSLTVCPRGDLLQKMRELGAEEFNKAMVACQDKDVPVELPMSDWRSNGAPVYWFSSPIHAIATIISILVIGLAWFFSARSKQSFT
ncbi:hypothetical protein M1B35_10830 [Pseudomonas sp. MAFF 302046]|uniref:Uncharacterized protein n=1 Tax=Pseudomonas morbosilactucae TaxID=2938197 RepID=A0ABT0JFD8_9PSED|nr:hypothetical protein [Pseudomonas morbosilactucae]MCK9814605.1 hypothetical protein [Pseudomonas morbosilactucae]